MAATGGGKIRSRRYHIASKPYAKSKQQQPGLISRVTDTVKSIVPSWLQKYFKNGDAAEGGGNTPEAEQNNQAPPPNGSEEVAPLPHERDSPEPSTSNTEPSTSRASLNFQDVLSRPPLNRTHLHFTSLDASSALGVSSALFSQPSTSSTPFSGAVFAGASSNFSLVKEIKDASSQHEDDNISTTSGFSSRASDKDVLNSKTASLPQLWSPETDRTHSGPQPAQSSLKKPAFNLSVFGTSSTSPMNSSVLNSSQLGDSPFYPGKTTYGGAAAVRSARSRPGTPYQAPVRRQIKVKPAGAQPCGVTSATARRILQSLERMSSPLADAKRIPSTVSSHLSTSLDWSLEFPAKKKRLDTSLPPVQKLVIPAAASVSGNRSMSFRPSLTPGGLGRAVERTLMPRETPKRQSPQIPDAVPGPSQSTSSLPYPLSSTPAASSAGSGGGKMKRERTSARPSSKRPEDEVAELSDLPAISLPISSFSLPTFSFSSPQPTSTVAPTATPMTPVPEEPVANKELPTASTPPCVPFTFSSPIVKATAASPPSFSPSSGFTFSAPVAKTGPSISNGKMAPPVVDAVKLSAIESIEEFEGPFKPAKVLKQGSVLDLLKGPGFASPVARSSPGPDAPQQTPAVSTVAPSSGFGDLFKPPAGSWDCDVCMVQNKASDTKCVACQTAQPNTDSSKLSYSKPTTTSPGLETTTTTTPSSVGFGGLFATPSGTWDCDTCLVQNKPDAIKCVACETAKPGTGVKPSLTLPAFSEAKTLPAATSTTTTSISSGFLGFGDKFKKPEGAWECDMCMVENKAQETKCVSCMSPKPGGGAALAEAPPSLAPASTTPLLGFGDKFKKPEGDWDCDVCCVQNKGVNQLCVACQTAKPGAKVEPKAFGSSSFGNQSSSDSGPGGFTFGTASSDSTSESGGFKFGGTLSDSSSSGGFKFGASSSDSSSSAGFKFGGASSEAASTDTGSSAGFKFGSSFKFGAASTPAVASASEDSKKAETPSMGAGFKFGASAGIVFGTGAASMESKPSEGGFSFGLSKPEEKTTAVSSTASTFNFPSSQENSEKDSGLSSTDTTSTTTTTAAPVFGKLAEPYLAPPLGGATFGESLENEQVKPAAPSFTFGKPEEKKEASMPSGFLFTAASKEAESSAPSMGFSFSKPDPPKDQPQPTFAFGKPAEKSETPSETPKPSFNFGQSATDAASAPTPPFGFMASSTSSSTTTTPAPSLFGTPSSSASVPAPAPAPAPNTFLFGQSSSTEATPAKTFLFGQSQDSQPAPAASLNAAPTPAPAQPFLFGSGTNTPAPSFAFGAAAPSTASSAAPAPSAAPFVFSSASSSGFGTGQAPTFGQGSSQPSTPAFGSPAPSPFSVATSQPPAFGAQPNAAPVFGQQANSTPAFGSSTTTAPGGGFQFGGASAFGASSSGTGMFAFGGSAGGSPAPSVTPSIAPQQSTPGGGFNFTQPPTFNMGAAKSTFTSTPAGPHSSISGRKIKTAVRRRK